MAEEKLGKLDTKKLALFSGIALVLIVIDQVIKYFIVKNIELFGQVVVIKKFFSLFYVRNTGSAFSLLADLSWGHILLKIVSVLGVVLFGYFAYLCIRYKKTFLSVSMCLAFSGAVGNMIDRFRFSYVIDYMRFDFGSYTFAIFNFADMCCVVGTIMLLGVCLFKMNDVDDILMHFKKKTTKKPEVEVNNDKNNG